MEISLALTAPVRFPCLRCMLKLGVNIDHVATLRQARYVGMTDSPNCEPDLIAAASICERAGASGITVHLRADRRHILDQDVFRLRASLVTKLNLEMGNTPEIIDTAIRVLPDDVCLVPENRQEVTTEGGVDDVRHAKSLRKTVERLQAAGIRVSMFIEPKAEQIEAAADLGAQVVELRTGAYSNALDDFRTDELDRLEAAAPLAEEKRRGINAGERVHLANRHPLLSIPCWNEFYIGHFIVFRCIFIRLG